VIREPVVACAGHRDPRAVNVVGTYNVLAAAVETGIDRVVLASSIYSVLRASLYHDRYGMDVIALRIGTCFTTPPDARADDVAVAGRCRSRRASLPQLDRVTAL
jgi:hypothetical protein